MTKRRAKRTASASKRTASGPAAKTRVNPSRLLFGAGAIVALLLAFLAARAYLARPAPWPDFEVVNVYPHDADAYTQGLLFRDGYLYESAGRYGLSSLRRVDLQTGAVQQSLSMDSAYFAEGLTDWGDELVQLTWRSNVGFVYDRETFELRREFPYAGEGWGLARTDDELIMSDGTADLRFLDPETLLENRRLRVVDGARAVAGLNELEFVGGQILANIWQTDEIVRIDPRTGHLTGRVDLTGLLSLAERRGEEDVLNGIAYDAATDRLFVTGKLWPKLFEIRLRDLP
jgi:glutamine cyclotransferase